jgi:hypothetical protein
MIKINMVNNMSMSLITSSTTDLSHLNGFPYLILNVFGFQDDDEKKISSRVCKLWLYLNSQPFGPCSLASCPSWVSRCQLWYPNHDFQPVRLETLKRGMKRLKRDDRKICSTKIQPTHRYLHETPSNARHKGELTTIQGNFKKDPYLQKVIESAENEEILYGDTHFPVYHSLCLSVFIFTLYTKHLLTIANFGQEELSDHTFSQIDQTCWIRFPSKPDSGDPQNIHDFLKMYPMENRGVNGKGGDHSPGVQRLLLCLNPFVFGNYQVKGEETFEMFLTNRSISPPSFEKFFNMLCDNFNILPVNGISEVQAKTNKKLREGFMKQLEELHMVLEVEAFRSLHKQQRKTLIDAGRSSQDFDNINHIDWGVLCQFLIPKDTIDDFAYSSQPYGIISHEHDPQPLSHVLRMVNDEPQPMKTVQLRMLTSLLTNFYSGVMANAYGFGDFFSSKTGTAAPIFAEVEKIFLQMLMVSGQQTNKV